MSWPAIVIYLVVLCVGLPAAFRNPTALALVIAWAATEIIYLWTGNNLPLSVYFMADIAVIAVIMAKPEACNLRPYRGMAHQLKCLLVERSVPDRIVLMLYGVCWIVYAAPLHPYYAWHLLWAITVAQFLAAGTESYIKYSRARAATRVAPDHQKSGMEFALVRGSVGYG